VAFELCKRVRTCTCTCVVDSDVNYLRQLVMKIKNRVLNRKPEGYVQLSCYVLAGY